MKYGLDSSANWPRWRSLIVVGRRLVLGIAGMATHGIATAQQAPITSPPPVCDQPAQLQKAIVPAIETDQDKLNNVTLMPNGMTATKPSGYPFKTVLANGRHLFTTPFIELDGAGEGQRLSNGEGPLGPREASFTSNLKLIQAKLGLLDSDFPKLLDLYVPPFAASR